MPAENVHTKTDGARYTTSTGAPIEQPYASTRLGANGPLLLATDFHHLDLCVPLPPLVHPLTRSTALRT